MCKSYIIKCPRCESKSYEILATHSHCIDCLYSPDLSITNAKKRKFMTLREAEKLLEEVKVHECHTTLENAPEVTP